MSHVGQVTAEPPRQAEGGFLALMRHRNYALLWTGQLVSLLGDRLQWVIISLWVYAQTGSALSVSFAIMALMLGPAIFGVLAGPAADLLDRKKILIYGDLLRSVLVFAIPDLMNMGLPWVYLDLFLISSVSAFFRPTMFAVIPQSVPKPQLLQANAFFSSMDTSTEIFGPALAGLVAALWGYSAGIYVNAFSYLVSALFSSGLRLERQAANEIAQNGAKSEGIFQSLREGLTYIRQDRIQMALLTFLLLGHWVAGLSSLQTPFAKGVLHISDQQFGWFQSIWGIGFVSASLILGWYGSRIPKGHTIVFGYLLWAFATGVLGLSVNYGMLIVSGFWVGFANLVMFIPVMTVLMEHTPSDKLGRVLSMRQIVIALVRVTALVGFGWLADLIGLRAAILGMATISFVGSLGAVLRFPALLQYPVGQVLTPHTSAAVTAVSGASRWSDKIMRYLGDRTEPEFIVSEQQWLNAAVLLTLCLGSALLLVISPIQGLAVVAAIGSTVVVAGVVRRVGRGLRTSARRARMEERSR